MRYIKPLLVLSLTLFAAAAMAQPGPPRIFGTFEPEVGVWAAYDVKDKSDSKNQTMRMSIVGKEGSDYWYEIWLSEDGTKNTIKMLVGGDPNDTDNVRRLIIQSGDGVPTEMPRDFVVMGRKMATTMFSKRSGMPAEEEKAAKVTVKNMGKKTVKVPAGEFTGTETQIIGEDGEVRATYVSVPEIKPFGVVWSESEGTVMELTGHGNDAKTRITAEPVKMEKPPGMPEGMPRGVPPGMDKMKGKQQ